MQHAQSLTPLVNRRVNNVLVKTAVDMNQPLFQVISSVDACLVNTFLHGCLYLIINYVEVWAVWMPQIQWNNVWYLSVQQFNSFISV